MKTSTATHSNSNPRDFWKKMDIFQSLILAQLLSDSVGGERTPSFPVKNEPDLTARLPGSAPGENLQRHLSSSSVHLSCIHSIFTPLSTQRGCPFSLDTICPLPTRSRECFQCNSCCRTILINVMSLHSHVPMHDYVIKPRSPQAEQLAREALYL